MKIDEVQFEVAGLCLAAKMWGDDGGTPALALHGWLDNAASFDRLAPLLPGLRLCALDFAGHGRSAHRPPGVPYHLVDNVAEVIGVADALGWQQFVLLGHSLGAAVGTLLAGAFPRRVRAAVLIEGLGPLTTEASGAPAALAKSVLQRLAVPAGAAATHYASFDEAVAARAGARLALSTEAATTLCRRGTREVDGGVVWRSDPRLRQTSPLRLTEDLVAAFIERIEAPTCLIRGADGPPVDDRTYSRRAAAHRNLEVVVLPGNHHLHLEDGAPEVATAVRRFLAGSL